MRVTVIPRRFGGLPAFALQAWMALIAWPFILAASAVTEPGAWAAISGWGSTFWLMTLASALSAGIIGNGLVFWLVNRHPMAFVAPYTLIAPPVTMVLGVLLLGEDWSARAVIGTVITLAGLLVITLSQRQRLLQTLEQPAAHRT